MAITTPKMAPRSVNQGVLFPMRSSNFMPPNTPKKMTTPIVIAIPEKRMKLLGCFFFKTLGV